MKRDWDLVRELLFEVEQQCSSGAPIADGQIKLEGRSDEEISYHLRILIDAGLVQGTEQKYLQVEVRRLTWEGHEFLDAARDDSRWNRAMETSSKAGAGMAFQLLKELLLRIMAGQIPT